MLDRPADDTMTQAEFEAIARAILTIKASSNGWGKVIIHIKAGRIDLVEQTSSVKVREGEETRLQE
jgi:hypothetical protein